MGGDKNVKLYMHPPSIPTRFQTILLEDGENKAFNSGQKRFQQTLSELPGPGYYSHAAERLDHAFGDLSMSRRGHVGFASKGKRFQVNLVELGPSPSEYRIHDPVYSQSLKNSLSPAFRVGITPLSSTNLVRTKTGQAQPTPGPLSYTIKTPKPTNGATSAFKSKTPRTLTTHQDVKQEEEITPVVKPTEEHKAPSQPTSSFKASGRDQRSNRNHGPAIGQYDITGKPQDRMPTRPQVKFKSIAPEPRLPKEPLSHQTSIPGSGQTPIAFPSPGKYNLASGTDKIKRSAPQMGALLSKTPRFKLEKIDQPGPGAYRVFLDPSHRSFHLNLSGNWV